MAPTVPAAAATGDSLERVGTPSLLIDLDVFDANLQAMADLVSVRGVRLRPHAKAHKTSAIARRQVALGAVGICCQKLSEAYPFAAAKIDSIHISNEFVGEDKLADIDSGVFNEVQPGSYVFLDGDYQDNDWTGMPRPGNSLFLLSTIMSASTADQAVCDIGLKGLAVDSGLPRSVSYLPGATGPALRYVSANDEHGMLTVAADGHAGGGSLEGRRIMLVPGHCDPTINLHDELICYRGDRVEAIWPIDARGLSR